MEHNMKKETKSGISTRSRRSREGQKYQKLVAKTKVSIHVIADGGGADKAGYAVEEQLP